MFPYSSNAYNPFAYINNHHHHHHSTNIRPESNFSMDTTTSIDHGNFQTTTQIDEDDDHDHHHHHDDGLLLSQLLSQQQLLLAQSDSDHHQIEELEDHHELEVDTNNTKAGGFLMMKKKKTTTTTTTVVPRRRTGKKDRHSKICTAQGPRDRRMRLSLQIARKFFDLQDMLGFDKASKTIEWLFLKSKSAIKELKENVSRPPQPPPPPPPPPPEGKPNCQIMSSCGNYNSEISRVRILESDHEKKKRNFFSKVGRESREKARERARERTREKMKMKMKIRSKQQSCSYDQDQEMKMEAVCAADHDQATIMDEELGAGGDDDELHYNCCGQQQGIMMMRGLSRSRWSMISDYLQQDQDHEIGVTSSTGANSEEDFLDNFHGNWDTTSSSASHVNNSKTQSFNCTISNNTKRFTAEAPAAGNPLCYPIFSTTNFSDIQAAEEEEEEEEKPITSNYYSINLFPNTCCSDIAPPGQNPSSIFMNQLSDQQQNPTTFNNTCPPTFLTSLIAQDHQNPTSNSSFTTSNIFWQSQFLENQYFSSNPII